MPRFSIVIPAYKSVETLPACLNSIETQTFTDWEAIVVNDASPDEIASLVKSYIQRDPRFSLVDKPNNEGTHMARKTGTNRAQGDWVLYLDSDDELTGPDILMQLDYATRDNEADIFRFGIVVTSNSGISDKAAQRFSEWANAQIGSLKGSSIAAAAFDESWNYVLPWRITHCLFRRELAQKAFSQMSDDRLEYAEDAYEYFVCAGMANEARSDTSIKGYAYHMGLGLTDSLPISTEKFVSYATSAVKSYNGAFAFAEQLHANSGTDLSACALGFKHKTLESVGNMWYERIPPENRLTAAIAFAQIVGPAEASCEFYRIARDLAWKLLADKRPFDDETNAHDKELAEIIACAHTSYTQAVEALGGTPSDIEDDPELSRCLPFREEVESHVAYLERRRACEANGSTSDIRIFVSAHTNADAFDSEILQQIQVGAAQAPERFADMLHDDEGENISTLNPLYCELTTQYWAWKNVKADFYGFCHYRRYFDFSDKTYNMNPWGEIEALGINDSTQLAFGLNDWNIRDVVGKADIIVTDIKILGELAGNFSTPLEHWHDSDILYDEDLERMIQIVEEMHPDYATDVATYLDGPASCFCNMFVMRADIFDDYCSWLFPLLETFMQRSDLSRYSIQALRTPGHLSERLLNIYLLHARRIGKDWTIKEVPCVHFLQPIAPQKPAPPSDSETKGLPVIPIVFAADNRYAPMLTTTIYSMLSNASHDRFYDITILTTDISAENQQIMEKFLVDGRIGNHAAARPLAPAKLSFYSVEPLIESYELSTNNPHIGVETYYRFLIQDILTHYDKVLYLDSDLIIQGDVSELFKTELGDDMLAAVIDVDFLGNMNLKDGERLRYAKNVLGLDSPYSYFQAGVLILNTDLLRKTTSVAQWLEIAQDPRFIYNDQDILNMRCQGHVTYLDPSWNVLNNGCNRIESALCHAPADIFRSYLAARNNDEKIIHYAGGEKPWNSVTCDRSEVYWNYAQETPFYETLIALFTTAGQESFKLMWPPAYVPLISEEGLVRKVIDPLLPQDSRRRAFARDILERLKGNPNR